MALIALCFVLVVVLIATLFVRINELEDDLTKHIHPFLADGEKGFWENHE